MSQNLGEKIADHENNLRAILSGCGRMGLGFSSLGLNEIGGGLLAT